MGIIPIISSRMLERLGHYGMRSMLVIYITRGVLHMSMTESATVYAWFTGITGLLPIVGGLIGDLLLGPRRASIAGGFIQAAGCFALCMPGIYSLYTGLGLIAAGLGMFQPNIVATLGLLYKGRPKLMDSAIMILYVAAIIGAFAGSFLMVLGDLINYEAVFISAGICMIASQLLLIFSGRSLAGASAHPTTPIQPESIRLKNSGALLAGFICLFILVPVFWIVENRLSVHTLDFIMSASGQPLSNGEKLISLYNMINPVVIVPGGIMLAIAWSFVNVSPLLKIGIGFLIYVLACASYHLLISGSNPAVAFLAGGAILGAVAELFISPTILSIICRYAPPRWISTCTGAFLTCNTIMSHACSFLMSFPNQILKAWRLE